MKFQFGSRIFCAIVALFLVFSSVQIGSTLAEENSVAAAIDAAISESYADNEPGVVVVAAKDGEVVFAKGYGMADLENSITIKPETVFRLGSITKQFTATAIMMLVEEGKIDLEDEITEFLPDYPTQDQKITIRHLLTHTSGIKSYTGMKEWLPVITKEFNVEEMIDFFKDQPMDFEPGAAYKYNNSGYFLLGAIIEKVSGKAYAEFINERIFTPLGMNCSSYDDYYSIVPNRASGYAREEDIFFNAQYMATSQPYAAGSLASSALDMVKWDEALYTDKLVSKESLEQMWSTNYLEDGSDIQYGFGWGIREFSGKKTIVHSGGIFGFVTHALRIPEEHIYVAVFTNTQNPRTMPDVTANKVVSILLGETGDSE